MVEDFAFAERARQHVIDGISPVFDLIQREDKDVDIYPESGNGMVEANEFLASTACGAEGLGLQDDEVDIRIGPGFASGAGAEEDDLVWVHFLDDGAEYGWKEIGGVCPKKISGRQLATAH